MWVERDAGAVSKRHLTEDDVTAIQCLYSAGAPGTLALGCHTPRSRGRLHLVPPRQSTRNRSPRKPLPRHQASAVKALCRRRPTLLRPL